MTQLLKRAMFAATTCALSLGFGVQIAAAATSPWSWTDLSPQVAERQNRPIWAIARAEPYWYFTDGQDLYTGGHVWRTDGGILSDVTSEVKNAGLSRVDDIVSDGQTVLFLKNVTSKNNLIEVVSYNGTYTNLTWQIRPYIDAYAGIVSVVGKNGSWALVTNQGKVLFWNGTQPSVGTFLPTASNYQYDMAYSMRHVAPADGYFYLPVAVSPVSNGWLVASRDSNGVTRFWKYTSNGISSEITNTFSRITNLQLMASNGNTALFGGYDLNTNVKRMYTYDGVNMRDVTSAVPSSLSNWNTLITGWNGTSWMLMTNGQDSASKHVFRFDGTQFQDLGVTDDFFLTIAGNQNGTFLVGGTKSDGAHPIGPSSPLIAKLVKVTEGYSNNTGSMTGTNYGTVTSNGISTWSWLEPNQTTLRRDQTMSFNVGAWSASGIKRIEMYANGVVRRTCDIGLTYGNQTCAATIYGGDYGNNTSVSLNARVTSGNDQVTWTSLQYVSISDYGTYTNYNNTNGDISVWNWFEPAGSMLKRNESTTLRVQGNATRGLNRIEVYANGSLRRTCNFYQTYGTQNCDVTVYGGDFAAGTQVTFNSRATDVDGRMVWSDLRTLTIAENYTDYTYNNGYSYNLSVPTITSPTQNQILTNYPRTLVVTWNGNAQKYGIQVDCDTCGTGSTWSSTTNYWTNGYTTRLDSIVLPGDNQYRVRVKAIDQNGTESAWSDYVYFRFKTATTATTPKTSNVTGSTWVWSSPEVSELNTSDVVTYNMGAWDPNGIKRIDIYANGAVAKTCNFGLVYGNQNCSYQVTAANTGVSYINVTARVVNGHNQIMWAQNKTYKINTQTTTN